MTGRPATTKPVVTIYTDGACSGNPGPGGWGAIVVIPEHRVIELGGSSPHTTNNKMELSGAIAALRHIAHQPGSVAIYTDLDVPEADQIRAHLTALDNTSPEQR